MMTTMINLLKDVEWKEFQIDKLFEIQSVYGKPIENYLTGEVPYISTSSIRNGTIDFIEPDEKCISLRNAISVDPIKGKAFFHKYNFVGRGFSGASINLLYKKEINKYIALFLCKSIENTACKKASYGYLFNGDRLRKAKILLPITKEGEPDYKFMEEYIKERENKLKNQYKEQVSVRIKNLQKKINFNKNWGEFRIKDIFTYIQRGKRLIKENQISGKIPYVSSSSMNNGVDNFISNDVNVRLYENCLSLANSGSVGSCFYEPFCFVASDHVTHLKGDYSEYTYLFLASMLNRLSEKYNFNREINDNRIKSERILLPIKNNSEPDFDFMEDYIKYIEQKKLLEYLNYIK